jgi:hypothetical protein
MVECTRLRQNNNNRQATIPNIYCSLVSLYILDTVLIYLPAHREMQYSRHTLAWPEAATGGGLGADNDRISVGKKCRTV